MENLLQDKPTYQLSYRKSFCLSLFFIFSLYIRTSNKMVTLTRCSQRSVCGTIGAYISLDTEKAVELFKAN